jgi:hypothetical protein
MKASRRPVRSFNVAIHNLHLLFSAPPACRLSSARLPGVTGPHDRTSSETSIFTAKQFVSVWAEGSWLRRMARGGHGLPKVKPGPAISYPSTPYGQATPQTDFSRFRVALMQGGRPAAVFYPFVHPTPYAYVS